MKISSLLALPLLLVIGSVNAVPYNSNVLIERGIDPHIINLAVTTFRQQIAYKMEIEYKKSVGDVATVQEFNLLYDPFASYGIDVRIQVPKADMEKYDEGDIKEELDAIMGLQSYLLTDKLYDEESLRVESAEGDVTIISFKFDKDAIPREIKFYKNLEGSIYIKNNVMEKIVINNVARFEYNGMEVKTYEKTLHFTKVPLNGGYLLKTSEVHITGEKDGSPVTADITGVVSKYWNEESKAVSWRSGASKRDATEDDEKYHTIFVDLDRTFPLLGQGARKLGYDLPKPFGIAAITMLQKTTLHMTSFELNGTEIPTGLIGGPNSKYESQALAGLIRMDMWLLPFINVGVILGGAESATDVTLDVLSGCSICPSAGIHELPAISTSSVLYGVGATVAGGAGNFFATVDMQFITAYTEAADLELDMAIITPIVGYNFQNVGVRALIGAQYQDMKEEIIATLDLDGDGNIDTVRVGLASDKWATLIGVEKGFNRHWNGSLMYSKGVDRSSLNMMIGYRF